jgi:hypothetical protein
MSGDRLPRTNSAQNKQFSDAVRQAESENGGNKLSDKDWERLHREASEAADRGEPMSFDEIVAAAKEYLPSAIVVTGAATALPDRTDAAQSGNCGKKKP